MKPFVPSLYLALNSIVTFQLPTSIRYHLALLTFVIGLISTFDANAQLTGTKNIPGNYADLAAAITDLNTQGVGAGGVILNVVAGNPQTSPAGGYVIGNTGSLVLTTSSNANQITVQGNGNTITAPTTHTVGNLNDAIFKLIGADWVTITGFTMTENAANIITAAATNNMTEWGVALLYVTATDGAQNNTIQTNTIDLNRTYQNTFGIYSNSTHTATAVTTSATATGSLGGNHNLKIFGNTVTDVNIGIVVIGPTAAADNNDMVLIGSTAPNANTISNYGTTGTFSAYANVSGTVFGILVRNTKNFNISFNSITSSNGGTSAGTLRGIYIPSFTNAPTGTITNTINNNSISVTTGVAAGTLQGITVETTTGNATTTLSINTNNFLSCGYNVASPTGAFTAISDVMANLSTSISNNTFTNLSISSTGSVTFIGHGYTVPAGGSQTISNNSIVTAFSKSGAGGTVTCMSSGTSSIASDAIITHTNNNFSNITVTGATTLNGISNSDGLSTTQTPKIITGNTFNNWTGGTNGITVMSYTYFGGITSTFSNNTITNITGQGAITAMNLGSSGNNGNPLLVSSNIINTISSTGTGGSVNGITCSNTSPSITISNNVIHSMSSTGASSSVTGVTVSGGVSTSVNGNTIHTLSSTGITAPVVNGISVSGGTITVSRNFVYGLTVSAALATAEVNGIRSSGGTSTYRNNMIALGNGIANAVAISGILESSGTNTFWHNSVYIGGSPSAGTGNSFAFNSAVTVNVRSYRDNIFVNDRSNSGATGKNYIVRVGGTAPNPAGLTLNNNVYYFSGTGGVFGQFNAVDVANLPAWKIAVGQDAGSIESNPQYLDPTNAIPNLHLHPTNPTVAEGNGFDLGVTDDFDGQTRAGLTPVDIGADAGNFVGADVVGPGITYTPASNSCNTSAITLSVIISDASGVPTAGIGLPVLYWKINAGAYTATTATFVSGSTYSFTFGGGVIVGDIVSYYIVAQDNAGTPNVSVSPSGGASGFSTNPPAVSTPPTTPSSYTILASLSGTYTVGSGGNYATLTAAVADYNTKCLSGSVVFSLTDASYTSPGETFPIILSANVASSAANTLTIKPASTINATITGSVGTGSIIKLDGADYIIIDGSNNGTSSRNLTIQNTTTTTSGNAVLWLASPATGNGSTNNIIKNTTIEGNASTTTFLGMYVGGNTAISLTSAGSALNNSNTIQNNLFRKTQYGLALFGFAAVSPDNNNVVSNNLFGTAIAGEGFLIEGIHADRQNNMIVSGNEVQNVKGTSGTSMYGIRLLDFKNGVAYNNHVHNLNYSGTSTTKLYGIALQSSSYTTMGNPSQATIYNNIVYDLTSSATSAVWNTTGMYAGPGYGDKYYFNSIHLSGQLNNSASGLSAAFANGDDNLTTFGTNLDVRNNIFSLTGSSTGGNVWAYYSRATSLSGTTQNNNVLRAAGTGATNNVARLNSINYTTLATWQAASGVDLNSLESDPLFNSNTNLIPLTGSPVLGAGSNGTGVTTDFLGIGRGTPPSIGAFEQAGDFAGPVITFTPLQNNCNTSAVTLSATITDATGVPTGGVGLPVLYWKINAGAYTAATGTFISGSTYSFSFGSGVVSGDVVSYYVVAQDNAVSPNVSVSPSGGASGFSFNPPAVSTPPTTPNTYSILPTLSAGSYNIGVGLDYATLTAAVADYNSKCMGGPIVFVLKDATYPSETFPISINSNPQASAINTLTIKPSVGGSSVISGSVASGALIKLNGADYVIIDGSNDGTTTRDLTITNTATTAPTAISLVSLGTGLGATNNTLKNLIISTGVATTIGYGISVGGSTPGTGGADNDNVLIDNNAISTVTQGIYANGTASISTGGMDNLTIRNNTISTNTTLVTAGIRVGNGLNSLIEKNTLSIETSAASAPVGISLESGFVTSSVSKNLISKVLATNTGGYGGRGITIATGTTTSALSISNNVIYGVNGSNWTEFGNSSSMGLGIGVNGTTTTLTSIAGGVQLYYNTINLAGSFTSSNACVTAALYVGSAATAISLQDNIFVNSLNNSGTGTTSKAYSIYSAATNTAFTAINYNDYFVSGAQGVLGFLSSDVTTLAALQTAFGGNANSLNVGPVFVSSTNLHLDPTNNALLNDVGTPIGGITTDFDGDTRSGTTPDMGMDEFSAPSCTGAVGGTATINGSNSFCGSGTPNITATGYSVGVGSGYQWMTSTSAGDYPLSGTPVSMQTNPASLSTGVVTMTRFYWLKVTCTSGTAIDYSNMLTITVYPSVASITGPNSKCSDDPAVLLTESGGTGLSWLWSTAETTQSISVNPGTTTTYTVTVTSTGSCTAVASRTVVVNANPTGASAMASANPVCPGVPFNLTSTATGTPPVILSEGFESGAAGWIFEDSLSSGVAIPAQLFHIQASPYTNTTGSATFLNFAISGSNFVLADADAGGSGSQTRTNLVSPAFSTVGYSGSATLTFKHGYRYWATSSPAERVQVQISTNGGTTWTNLSSYEGADVGVTTNNAQTTIVSNVPIPAIYMGLPSVKIRFRYRSNWGYYWVLDDVAISAGSLSYSWASAPAGFSSIDQNPTGVTQVSATNYTVTITGVGGCQTTASTGVVNMSPAGNSGTLTGSTSLCIGANENYTSNGDVGGTWSSSNLSVATIDPNTGIASAVAPGTTNITYTVTSGCTASSTMSVTVNSNTVSTTSNSGANSLRDVIGCAAPGSTVLFAPAMTGQTITLTTTEIVINKNLTVSGPGMLNLIISGNNNSRIFNLLPGNLFVIKNLSLKNATSLTNGGAIYVQGNLNLENVLLQNNFENGVPKAFTTVNPSLIEIIGTVDIKN